MKKLIASAKPGSRMVMIGKRYIVAGSRLIWVAGREVMYYPTIVVRRMKHFDIMRSLVRKHYRRAILFNKKRINKVFINAGMPVPAYKDCQVTDIVLLIKSMSKEDSGEIAQAIMLKFNLCGIKLVIGSSQPTGQEQKPLRSLPVTVS